MTALLAHISDLHLDGSDRSTRRATQVMDHLRALPRPVDALLEAHPHVAAVLTGHAHTAAATTFAARPLIVGPAITWTLRLPWEGDKPADRDQPPGLAFHVLDDDHRLTTHFRVIP